MERILTSAQATSAAAIQHEIDVVGRTGGRVILPRLELELDRGLRLRSGVELCGQGEETVLRKGPEAVYPLVGYHNYGMLDVPVESTAGLEVGMTVSVHDGRTHGGFHETFATVTWIDGQWVGLDHGIEADYGEEYHPCLTTAYPLVFGLNIRDAALRGIDLVGQREANAVGMGGCRGGAVYFANCRDIQVTDVHECDYSGEGLSFQMCRDISIIDCSFDGNTGNGLHPGAGSTNVLFDRCRGIANERCGFFFCVRANHVTVRDSRFADNAVGMSIGTRDCHNFVDACVLQGNRGPGMLMRETPASTEVFACHVRNCEIRDNATVDGNGQVEIACPAHDLVLDGNAIHGSENKPGISTIPEARNIFLQGNTISGCGTAVAAPPGVVTRRRPRFECGFGDWPKRHFRHLRTA